MAEEDRISSLPDHVLLEIISRIKIMVRGIKQEEERLMSTKEVIKTTTTISKRWRHLWTLLPTLVFIDDDAMIDRGNDKKDVTKYIKFIEETLNQCRPTDVNLKQFKLHICDVKQPTLQINRWMRYAITRNIQEIDLRITDRFENHVKQPTLQINRWIHYAITRNVQEIDLRITDRLGNQSCDNQLFFNNSCLTSMEVSGLEFNPPNGTIRWDKLKFLRIHEGKLDEDLIRKILSGSPCLECLELNDCIFGPRIPKSLFGNFGVLECLSCHLETYKRFSNVDELFLDNTCAIMSITLSRCVINPPSSAIGCDKLKFLRIDRGELDEDLIGYILSGSPFLETLQLHYCGGFSRIDVTSKSVKNLVLSGYRRLWADYYYKHTLEINAPYILSLTIKEKMCLQELLLQDVSSLVKADLNYWVSSEEYRGDKKVVEENLLLGILSSLVHVNEIALGSTLNRCDWARTYLEATGFQFHKGSYLRGICPTANEFSH